MTSRASVRPAGSSGTQKVCEKTKSRNRTGSRAWRKSSAHRPPAHAVAAAGADSKDPEVHSAVKAGRVVNQKCDPEGRGSVRRDGLF